MRCGGGGGTTGYQRVSAGIRGNERRLGEEGDEKSDGAEAPATGAKTLGSPSKKDSNSRWTVVAVAVVLRHIHLIYNS
jgi:hypothetical protein